MHYIYIGKESRAYLKAIVTVKAAGGEHRLMRDQMQCDPEAESVFCEDKDILKVWTDAGVSELDIDSDLFKPDESVPANDSETESAGTNK